MLNDNDGTADGYLVITGSTGSATDDLFSQVCDSNGDGWVDELDLAYWQSNFEPRHWYGHNVQQGDWNVDGEVDVYDMFLWQQNVTRVPDTQSPSVANVVVNDGQVQHSNVTSIEIEFDEQVNLADLISNRTIDDVVQIYDLNNDATALNWLNYTNYNWNSSELTLVIDLTADGFGGSEVSNLANGRYKVEIDTAAVTDVLIIL